jgi:cysteinyl-tRNA synthetase
MNVRKKILSICILICFVFVLDIPCEISFFGEKQAFYTNGRAQSMSHVNYKEEMITLVEQLSTYAKSKNPSFEMMNNQGIDLFRPENVEEQSLQRLLKSVSGVLVEDYSYRWEKDEIKGKTHTIATANSIQNSIDTALAAPITSKRPIFIIDYCQDKQQMDKSYKQSAKKGYRSLASSLELDSIPQYPATLPGENNNAITTLSETKNFLALLNPGKFNDKEVYLASLRNTNYDLLIIDLCFDSKPLTNAEVNSLKVKKNGAPRLVFAYMSVGEAEDYRPYWQKSWSKHPPKWIAEVNPDWTGNFKVKYWSTEWKQTLFGSPNSSLDMILAAGFNGTFNDVIDAYDYFENK